MPQSKLLQLCPPLCDSMDCSPPGSPVHGILQARILEWVAIFFSRGSSRFRDQTQVYLIVSNFIFGSHWPSFLSCPGLNISHVCWVFWSLPANVSGFIPETNTSRPPWYSQLCLPCKGGLSPQAWTYLSAMVWVGWGCLIPLLVSFPTSVSITQGCLQGES